MPPAPLSPSRPRDEEEEEGEGEIEANIKAEPPAGFPLSGWARGGVGRRFLWFTLCSSFLGYIMPL